MKKVLNGTITYCGKPARISCIIRDTDGYISITGEIFPYRCRTSHCGGCIHDEIAKAFPKMRKYLWLHLIDIKDSSFPNDVANSLYYLANDDEKAAQRTLQCTDEELREISAFVRYGLHKRFRFGSYSVDAEDSKKLYADFLAKFHFEDRRKKAIAEFYEFLNTL